VPKSRTPAVLILSERSFPIAGGGGARAYEFLNLSLYVIAPATETYYIERYSYFKTQRVSIERAPFRTRFLSLFLSLSSISSLLCTSARARCSAQPATRCLLAAATPARTPFLMLISPAAKLTERANYCHCTQSKNGGMCMLVEKVADKRGLYGACGEVSWCDSIGKSQLATCLIARVAWPLNRRRR